MFNSKTITNFLVLGVAAAFMLPAAISYEPPHPHVTEVHEELPAREGVGDDLTTVQTGSYGVTRYARAAVGASTDMTDPLVALEFLRYLDERWHTVRGYSESPESVKRALLDSTYNLGEQVLGYSKLRYCLGWGDYLCVVESLLDTANVEGKSVKGLAIRRANAYNEVAIDDIMFVKQEEDGEVAYATATRVVMRYKPEGGKHEKSKAGLVLIAPNPSGLF